MFKALAEAHGLLQKSEVKNPGSRGGKFYYNEEGKIVYGTRPDGGSDKTPRDSDIIQQYMPVLESQAKIFAHKYGGSSAEYLSSAYLGALASLKSNNLDNVSIGTNLKMYVFKYLREQVIEQRSVVKQRRDATYYTDDDGERQQRAGTANDNSLNASVGGDEGDMSFQDVLADDRPDAFSQILTEEKLSFVQRLEQTLKTELPPKEFKVWQMIVIDGESFEDAGAAIGHSKGTVFNYLAKAKDKIEKLKELGKLTRYEEDSEYV